MSASDVLWVLVFAGVQVGLLALALLLTFLDSSTAGGRGRRRDRPE